MKIAVLSDIHGNLPALEAVLADARGAGPDMLLNLGDILSGPLWPAETADLLMPLGLPSIRGNHERNLLTKSRDKMNRSDRHTAGLLGKGHLDWIEAMPATLWLTDEIFLCHATPGNDIDYYVETVDASGARPATPDEVRARTGTAALGAKLILCGHSHLPRTIKLAGGPLVMNPGSVGLPAYFDDDPVPHVMETGTPHARYALISRTATGWAIEHRAVAYDHRSAATRARQNGREDWTKALMTGRALWGG